MLLFHEMSEKNVILHEEITSSEADTVSVVGSARTHFANSIDLHVPLKRNFLWRWAKRVGEPGWSSGIACCWRSWWKWWRCGEGDTNRGWGCRCCLGCSRVGNLRVWVPGFQFLKDCLEKRTWGTDFVWGCYWHRSTSEIRVFKPSKLPLTFYLDYLAGRSMNSVRLVIPRALKLEDDFVRLLCWVYNCSGEPFVHPDIFGTSRIEVSGSEFEVDAPTSEEDVRKGGF